MIAFRIATRWLVLLLIAVFVTPTRLFGQFNLPAKLRDLEATARRDSNDAAAQYNVALGYWNAKRFDDAEHALRTAVQIDPRFASAYLALGYLPYARRHRLMEEETRGEVPPELRTTVDEARHMRRRAFLINPFVDLQIIGAVVPIQASMIGRGRHGELVISVDPFSAFVRGDYPFAYSVFTNWIAESAKNGIRDSVPSGLFWFRGLSAGHVAAYDTAVSDFSELLSRSIKAERSDSVSRIPLQTNDYRYIVAWFKQRLSRSEEAAALYKEALGNDVGLFMAHLQLGSIYAERGLWPTAIEHYQSAVTTNPDDPSLLLELGVALRQAGLLAQSESTLVDAMQANPRDSRVPYHLGLTLRQAGKQAEARDAFTRFLVLAPQRYERQIAQAKQYLNELR